MRTAPCADRCVAYFIDGFLNCIPFYLCWKDGIRDGKSFGKGLMNLRVVKYGSRKGATVTDSCVRNCLCGWCDGLTCFVFALFGERRRIGDRIAGTMVVRDR